MFSVGERTVGDGRCLIVGEVAQAHDGSLGMAHAFIDAIADAGADAVKFQTHIAEAESTPEETFRRPLTRQDPTRYDYWKRTAFSEDEWRDLAEHASRRALLFFSSPFSPEAVDLLERVGMPAWKIASGELTNRPLLERVAQTGFPVFLSTGMSGLGEIDKAVKVCRERQVPLAVMQSTSLYPCPAEKIGLNLLEEFRSRYSCPVGLSDHSGTIFPGLAATALGADIIEVHVTFSRAIFGPDVPVSLTIDEFAQFARGIRFIECMRRNPVAKDSLLPELEVMRRGFSKSLVLVDDLPVGTVLEARHLALKKPGFGIPAKHLEDVVGTRLSRSVKRNHFLRWGDVEVITTETNRHLPDRVNSG